MKAVILEKGRHRRIVISPSSPAAGEVQIRVAYAGCNRVDLLQRQGRYPVPDGAYAVPGLEVAGTVNACGPNVDPGLRGHRVAALVKSGGWAEFVNAPAAQCLLMPNSFPLATAASLPESLFTAWISLFHQARLLPGETVLIHGGAGGVGSLAVSIARHHGARVFTTAGTDEKCTHCLAQGAERAINHRTEDFVAVVREATGGNGVDVILDAVGGEYWNRNFKALAQGGRMAVIAFQDGAKIALNAAPLLLKHLSVYGSTLRSRSLAEKAAFAAAIRADLWPAVLNGGISPLIDRVFPLEEAEKAMQRMEEGLNCGKIILKV